MVVATKVIALLAALILLAPEAPTTHTRPHRSTAAKNAFKLHNPCPSTNQPRGPCPGYVIDHIRPLCAGGPDLPSNMQWQNIIEGKAKDHLERQECGLERRPDPQPNPTP